MSSEDDERFTKAQRLRKRREFLLVQRKGRRINLKNLIVFTRPGPGRTRIGVTVSRKVGGAVQRNRVKRVIREAYRRNKDLFPPGLDIVLVAKVSARKAEYQQLVRQLGVLGRLH